MRGCLRCTEGVMTPEEGFAPRRCEFLVKVLHRSRPTQASSATAQPNSATTRPLAIPLTLHDWRRRSESVVLSLETGTKMPIFPNESSQHYLYKNEHRAYTTSP